VDLNEVRMFVHVVRARSFAEASRRLRVPPNTLSRRIRQLESTLDTRLMQRSTRKLTLTAAGHEFFERCAPAVDGVVEAGKELKDGSRIPGGCVRIAAPADFLDLFPVEWVSEFLELHPAIRLDFILSDARADLIAEGIDVAFRGGTMGDTLPVFRQISPQYLRLVASPLYVARRGAPRTLQALSKHDCLTASSPASGTKWTLQGPGGSDEVVVSGKFSANSARILVKACLAGLGIALLPAMMTAPHIRTGRLIPVLGEYRRGGADFNVVLPSRQLVPSSVMAFVDFATTKLQGLFEPLQISDRPRARRRERQ
jgi:DNA-binding transcriptional LysR family regulator